MSVRRSGLMSSLLLVISAAPALAGPIEDWLFPRSTSCAPVSPVPAAPACGPVTVNSPVVGPCGPCPTPVGAAVVSAPAAPVVPAAAPSAGGIFGGGAFRTAWVQVPVTVYRPVATIDPATGATVSTTQACTTYRWQLRRVPASLVHPAYNMPAAAQAPAFAVSPAPAGAVWQAAPAATGGCASCGASGGQVMYAPVGQPAVVAPAPAPGSAYEPAPSLAPIQTPTGAPTPAPPWNGANPQEAPSLTPMRSPSAGGPSAADTAPSLLKPNVSGMSGTPAAAQAPPQGTPSNTVGDTLQPRPLRDPEGASQVMVNPSAAEAPPVGLVPVQVPDATATTGPASPIPSFSPSANPSPVASPGQTTFPVPIQSPASPSAAGGAEAPLLQAPLLLNPNDRSASAPSAVSTSWGR